MGTPAREDTRLSLWRRVRAYAVPPTMIETATARRLAGDWAGACAAARVDLDLAPRTLARTHGTELAARVRADLRRLAPDLLRWHLPRTAPDGLLRPGLTVTLAVYAAHEGPRGRQARPVHLVARTAPAWADAGQRISLALWDGPPAGTPPRRRSAYAPATAHPHPHPSPRFRLDLHRHLWDATRAAELRTRSGADRRPAVPAAPDEPPGPGWAVDRWADEARLLLAADGPAAGPVLVRLTARHRLLLTPEPDGGVRAEPAPTGRRGSARGDRADRRPAVLPDAATWTPPDLALLRAGLVTADDLHPLVAEALVPAHRSALATGRGPVEAGARLVECQGRRHRIALVDGVLTPLDHDPAELRREELLVALSGTPLPCLRAIDEAHRVPEGLTGVRERLAHGDTAGALAVVEALLGPDATLRDGPLRRALERAAERKVLHGLYRAGLRATGPGTVPEPPPAAAPGPDHGRARRTRSPRSTGPAPRPLDRRDHPRHALAR
ncbi:MULTISPECIES: hypothetical protein [Streptomyces]|uniref:Uncharacterized protein n=2 Tax=Streptomyces TaxID=1883 RepID=A0ABU4K212_9ACTN|nr:hypothetical protein [Streptomyces roseolus]MDX2291743.1 hypothetical protein [Streptomyces roseolus]